MLAGADRRAALCELVERADLLLCLISADLLAALGRAPGAGEAELGEALRLALSRHQQEGVPLVPVYARPATLDGSPFAGLEPLPRGGQPLSRWPDLDEPLVQIVAEVRRLALSTAKPG